MFKKSLVAAAALMAMAGAATATQVQLYGVIDTSIIYENTNAKLGQGRQGNVYMSSGEEWGSRWGIKGTEDLGNGYTVGFDLQSGIRSDDGQTQYNRLFARESSLYVKGPFGKVAFGRLDGLIGLRGQTGKLKCITAFGDGYGPYMPSYNNVMSEVSYVDNSIFYESPNMAGLTLRAHYGMGGVGNGSFSSSATSATENKSSADRYAAATATYSRGPATAMIGVDRIFYAHTAGSKDPDDSLTVTVGGNWNFGFMRAYVAAQYFDEVTQGSIRKFIWSGVPSKLTGYGASISADIPACGGNFLVAISYMDAESADSVKSKADVDVKRLIGGVGYQYNLSKRTHLYGILSAGRDQIKTKTAKTKPDYYKAALGLRHVF